MGTAVIQLRKYRNLINCPALVNIYGDPLPIVESSSPSNHPWPSFESYVNIHSIQAQEFYLERSMASVARMQEFLNSDEVQIHDDTYQAHVSAIAKLLLIITNVVRVFQCQYSVRICQS